jgi:ubiquinone/menaquinone biosynthesis C-methylase UbiE
MYGKMMKERYLSREEARRFYDRFGSKQDAQAFYEDAALELLARHSAFESASRVVEVGCGTGRFAERLLQAMLPATATYWGCDISATMVALARKRLAPFGGRARVDQVSGEPPLPVSSGGVDRFVSTYVFDLLAPSEIEDFLAEAWRILVPGGRLCTVSIARGHTLPSKLVMSLWSVVSHVMPGLVGGCRPIEITPLLSRPRWAVVHQGGIVAFGVASEVVAASRLPDDGAALASPSWGSPGAEGSPKQQ